MAISALESLAHWLLQFPCRLRQPWKVKEQPARHQHLCRSGTRLCKYSTRLCRLYSLGYLAANSLHRTSYSQRPDGRHRLSRIAQRLPLNSPAPPKFNSQSLRVQSLLAYLGLVFYSKSTLNDRLSGVSHLGFLRQHQL